MAIDYITKSSCDCCLKPNRKGLMFHDRGVPVYFGCRTCHPKNYRSAMKRQRMEATRKGYVV